MFCRTLTKEAGPGSDTIEVYNENDSSTDWRHENYTGTPGDEIGLYHEFDHGGVTKMRLQTRNGASPRYTFTESEPCFVLVQVNAAGEVVGFGQAEFGTPYITESCWASAMGGA
ncbi:MAG: hypothetical protein IBX56_19625 [Methylomicrobium sp.]|nr:hypothetical protein [Methylomicrobium sp.]